MAPPGEFSVEHAELLGHPPPRRATLRAGARGSAGVSGRAPTSAPPGKVRVAAVSCRVLQGKERVRQRPGVVIVGAK